MAHLESEHFFEGTGGLILAHKNGLHSNVREINAMDKIVGDIPEDHGGNFSDLAMLCNGILPFCQQSWLCFKTEFNATSTISLKIDNSIFEIKDEKGCLCLRLFVRLHML